jgi:hypothetical protein
MPTAVLVALFGSFALAVSAREARAVSLVRCVGTESLAYSPGITDTPAPTTVTITDVLSPCVSVLPLWTGSATVSRTIPSPSHSCTSLLRSVSTSKTYSWSDATTSTFTFNTIVDRVRGQLVISEIGAITAGRYRGSTGLGTIVAPGDLTACSTSTGLTRVTGVYTLDIAL